MDKMFSIIVPTFNRADVIGEAIESVLAQSFQNWELFVIDDGSSDETKRVVAEYEIDPRIRYFKQENRGQASARNVGIRAATGKFVAFLDSDDRWLPEKLALQADAVRTNPESDVFFGEIANIDSRGQPLGIAGKNGHSGVVWRRLLVDNFVEFSTAVVRRSRILEVDGMDESVRRGDDYDLWLRLSTRCRFVFQPVVLAEYRAEGDRISDDLIGRMRSNRQFVDQFFARNPQLLSNRDRRDIESRFYARFARAFQAKGEIGRAVSLALRSILRSPFSWVAWRTTAAITIKPFLSSFRSRG